MNNWTMFWIGVSIGVWLILIFQWAMNYFVNKKKEKVHLHSELEETYQKYGFDELIVGAKYKRDPVTHKFNKVEKK